MSEYDYLRNGFKVGEKGYLTCGIEGTVTGFEKGQWVEIEGTRLPLRFDTPGVVHLSMLPADDVIDDYDEEGCDACYDLNEKVEDAIATMDRLTGADPERDHGIADDLLLSLVPPNVRDAYHRLTDRARWWGAA